ncbi:hypothetical protein FHS67_006432 [Aminobacter aminovorans]|uniref:Uncharacterized protein n=1 Tax=Aminobacter aminovorans TaxID=83263 RepID=A0AAC8YVJ7_AMIAI|nr:hypothetical protein AA2016_6167 [Aminobacter aminovorans]MBB3710072.1 hypothetical protein [Aminobacter aminovorans]
MLRVFAIALVGYFTYRIPTEFMESVPWRSYCREAQDNA